MNPILDALGSLANAATGPAIAWFLVRLTVIAAVGHLALTLMHRATAATRHVVALAALAATIVIPFGTELLPAWQLPILPAKYLPVSPSGSLVIHPDAPLATTGTDPYVLDPAPPSETAKPRANTTPETTLEAPTPTPLPLVETTRPERSSGGPLNLPAILVAVLLIVTLGMLARVELGLCAAWITSWCARDVEDEGMLRELARARDRLGIRTGVRLKSSPWVDVPVVFGIVRPVLIVPETATEWSVERLRSVFLHELAHVARRDVLGQLLGNLATSIYWFHPLVWMLARDARRECERACDDVVLGNGVRATDYANDLLSIARAAHRDRLATMTLAFSRQSSLEERLVSILRPDAARGPASRMAVVATLLAMLVLIPLATVRVIAAPADVTDMAIGDPAMRDVPSHAMSGADSRSKTDLADTHSNASADADADAKADDAAKAADAMAAEAASAADAAPTAPLPAVPSVPVVPAVHGVPAPGDVRFELAGSRSGEGWWNKAHDLYRQERYDQAGVAYENAAKADYRADVSWYNAACSYALDNQRTRALGALKNALAEGFDSVDLLQTDTDLNSIRSDSRFQLMIDGMMKSDVNEPARRASTRHYEALKAGNSNDGDRWGSCGIDLMRAGETDRAVDAFERQIRIDGASTGIYNLACAHALGGNKDKAFEALERSINAGYGDPEKITSDPDLYSLHRDPRFEKMVDLAADLELYSDGLNDNSRSDWEDEMPRFQRATQEHPSSGRAWFNLGYAQLKVRDAKSSYTSFKKALDLGYRKPTTLYNLACSSAQMGDKDAAIKWLQQADAAGFSLEWRARWDRDLFPLRSDPRFRDMINRWDRDREQKANKHDKDKSAYKYEYKVDKKSSD